MIENRTLKENVLQLTIMTKCSLDGHDGLYFIDRMGVAGRLRLVLLGVCSVMSCVTLSVRLHEPCALAVRSLACCLCHQLFTRFLAKPHALARSPSSKASLQRSRTSLVILATLHDPVRAVGLKPYSIGPWRRPHPLPPANPPRLKPRAVQSGRPH